MTTTGKHGHVIDADRRSAFTGRSWVRWTKRMKRDFLDHLASTCNVADAAAAIGIDATSVYGLRRRDEAFAADWAVALAAGYEMLETLVVGHLLAGRDGRGILEGRYGPIDLDQALRLLSHHRGALQGKPAKGGPRLKRVTRAETDAALLKKLVAIEKRKAPPVPALPAPPVLPAPDAIDGGDA